MKATAETQTEFETLYNTLIEFYTDYALATEIAAQLEKTHKAIYMYFRQQFTGGSDAYKRSIITAMKTLLPEQTGEAA